MPLTLPPTPENKETRLRVLLCGYGHLGLALLQGLLESAQLCEVVGVFRWSSRPESANCWEPVEGMFQKLVTMSGIEDIQCPGINTYEFTTVLGRLKPDVVLVGAWGEILKQHLIERPDLLLVNCHPSKLPAHRGANPYSSVIRERETETGVTFHRIVLQIDAGAILLQQTVPLHDQDSGASVRDRCAMVAYQLVKALVPKLHATVVYGFPLEESLQDDTIQSYFPPLTPEAGLVDWKQPAEALHRQYRALFPWIVCYSHLKGGRRVLFYDPHFIPRASVAVPEATMPGTLLGFKAGKLQIALADPDWVLEVGSYQIEGGRDFLPVWLGRLIAPLVFRSGKRFQDPGEP